MKSNDAARAHFDSVSRLLGALADEPIELLEHHYHPQSFGSFELILARGHDWLKFTWDGKESILSLSFAKVQNLTTRPEWTHDANFSLPAGEGLYAEIASQSVDMLDI